MFNFLKKNDGFNYLKPMKKAAKSLLQEDYPEFKKEIDLVIKHKAPYIIGADNKKYYTEYISEDDHEKLNSRYLLMAKEKDLAITKRDGKHILECEIINYVGDDLEQYFINYAKIKNRIIHIKNYELQEQVKSLLQPYNISFSFDYLASIQIKYSQNNNFNHTIEHHSLGYSSEVWSLEEIELFKKTALLLEKQGLIFFILNYSSDARWFGLINKTDYKLLNTLLKIDAIKVTDLLTEYVGDRHYSYIEKFRSFYADIEIKILKNKHEIVYKIDASNKASTSLSKIGGKGIGVDNISYPMFGDTPMQHACTFDLHDFPNLQIRYPKKRAVSLYISDFKDNEAFEAYEGETKILLLSQYDIDNKSHSLKVTVPIKAFSMIITPLNIPKGHLEKSILEYKDGSWKQELYNYMHNFNYVGSHPTWMQDDSHIGDFIAQFDQTLFEADGTSSDIMNFGGGVMYMFDDTAFWQCG